ncbi:MAG: XdhC family protein [Candidatus Hydrogenedentes bacterium]|nr:XdhC family protein [Candidatus Hydrogenedentota bacterium]
MDTPFFDSLLAAQGRYALATVVHSIGSTPQKAGAKALFFADGRVVGTLGGGCLEAEAQRRALRALDTGTPLDFEVRLDEVDGWDDGLVCGGKVRILIDPRKEAALPAIREAVDAHGRGVAGILYIPLQGNGAPFTSPCWMRLDQVDAGFPPACAARIRELVQREQCAIVSPEAGGDIAPIYVEPVVAAPRLVIAGAGHIGRALAHFGALLGFEVTVIDDRPAFANTTHVPDAQHHVCGSIGGTLRALDSDTRTYFVIVTRGHQHDAEALEACVHKPAAYLGLIGSKRKSLLLRQGLIDRGIATEADLARLVTPMGLDIGGRTVEEIALSIAAQLTAVRRRGRIEAAAMALPLHP